MWLLTERSHLYNRYWGDLYRNKKKEKFLPLWQGKLRHASTMTLETLKFWRSLRGICTNWIKFLTNHQSNQRERLKIFINMTSRWRTFASFLTISTRLCFCMWGDIQTMQLIEPLQVSISLNFRLLGEKKRAKGLKVVLLPTRLLYVAREGFYILDSPRGDFL